MRVERGEIFSPLLMIRGGEMKKKVFICGMVFSCFIFIYLCIQLIFDDKDKLVIYVSGAHNIFFQNDDNRDVYSTPYSIGYFYSRGQIGFENGNVLESAIKEYAKSNNLEVEIQYLSKPTEENGITLLENSYNNSCMPDLIIASRAEQIDYTNLYENELLFDWSEYMEKDEGISYDSYYMEVLQGGIINNEQVVIPLLFNLNGIISDKVYLAENEIDISKDLTYQEIVEILQQSCISMMNNERVAGIAETSGQMLFGQYIPSILLSSAYSSYYYNDGTTWNTNIESDVLEEIINTVSLYQRQDCAGILEWESNSYEEIIQNPMLKSKALYLLDEHSAIERSGVFITGGRCGGQEVANSFLTDVIYFSNKYGKKVWIQGIPSANSKDEYNANISLCAFSPASTEHADEVYDLIRYLMDYEYGMCYGFSINRDITYRQLQDAKNIGVEFYPDIWGAVEAGQIDQNMLYKYKVQLDPIGYEEIAIIYNMLDNISGAGVSSCYIEYYLMEEVVKKLGSRELSEEGVAKWAMERIIQYKDDFSSIKPFS